MKYVDSDSPILQWVPKAAVAGAIASLFTHPLDVLKTNLITYSSLYTKDIHQKIMAKGWRNYMKGASLAIVRQGYGFTLYTTLLNEVNKLFNDF